jgi:hypothetical protein
MPLGLFILLLMLAQGRGDALPDGAKGAANLLRELGRRPAQSDYG